MPFPRRLLTEGEDVVVELRPHWVTLGWPLVAALASVTLAVGVVAALQSAPIAVMYLLLAIVVVSALWLAGRMVRWFTTSLVVTNTRIVQRSGVLARRGLELRLERVNQLSYHQSLSGRVLRTGELFVEMGGETGVVVFDHVPRPAAVQSLITEQIEALHRRSRRVPEASPPVRVAGGASTIGADTPPEGTARVPGGSGAERAGAERAGAERKVGDRLVELDDLRRRSIITDAEFQAKRAELIDRL
jgi:hypothetical protein